MNDKFDQIHLGYSIYSLIAGFKKIRQGESIAIVGTDFKANELANDIYFSRDIAFLKEIGQKLNIQTLNNIESYQQVHPLHFKYENKNILLGLENGQSLFEYLRKFKDEFLFSELLDSDASHLHFESLNEKIAYYEQFYSNSLVNAGVKIMTFFEKDFLQYHKSLLSSEFLDASKLKDGFESISEGERFLYSVVAYLYKNNLILYDSSFKLDILSILISTFYSLSSSFYNDLMNELIDNGGVILPSDINKVEAKSNQIQSIVLNSYEGSLNSSKYINYMCFNELKKLISSKPSLEKDLITQWQEIQCEVNLSNKDVIKSLESVNGLVFLHSKSLSNHIIKFLTLRKSEEKIILTCFARFKEDALDKHAFIDISKHLLADLCKFIPLLDANEISVEQMKRTHRQYFEMANFGLEVKSKGNVSIQPSVLTNVNYNYKNFLDFNNFTYFIYGQSGRLHESVYDSY